MIDLVVMNGLSRICICLHCSARVPLVNSSSVRIKFPLDRLFPEPDSPLYARQSRFSSLSFFRSQGAIQKKNTLLIVTLQVHKSRETGGYFIERRLILDLVDFNGELVLFAIESVDVQKERVTDSAPWRVDGYSFTETRDDGVVCD